MGIKMLASPVAKVKKSKAEISTVQIDTETGTVVADYLKAAEDYERAEALKKVLGAQLKLNGFHQIADMNVANSVYTNSIRLQDGSVNPETKEPAPTVLFSLSKTYLDSDPATVEAVFESLGLDAGEHVQQVYKPAFDEAAFNDADGNFNLKRYEKFAKAAAKIATDLGIENPLTVKAVLRPKESFHASRWSFTNKDGEQIDADGQEAINEVFPNKVSLKR